MKQQGKVRGTEGGQAVSPSQCVINDRWGVVKLVTPGGLTLYVAADDDVAVDLRAPGTRTVLTRSEIDAALSLACCIAPPDHHKLTLRRILFDLLAVKQALPEGGPAVLLEPDALRGETVDVEPTDEPTPAAKPSLPAPEPAEPTSLLAAPKPTDGIPAPPEPRIAPSVRAQLPLLA